MYPLPLSTMFLSVKKSTFWSKNKKKSKILISVHTRVSGLFPLLWQMIVLWTMLDRSAILTAAVLRFTLLGTKNTLFYLQSQRTVIGTTAPINSSKGEAEIPRMTSPYRSLAVNTPFMYVPIHLYVTVVVTVVS